jgi:DNA-binding transcriptional regulator YiaG
MDAVEEVLATARLNRLCQSGEARRRREENHVSQAALGRAVGVSDVTILRWERGERTPTGPEAWAYLDLLDRLATVRASA